MDNTTCFMSKREGISFDRTRYYEGMDPPNREDIERVNRVIKRAGNRKICYSTGVAVDRERKHFSDMVSDD